LGCNSGVNWPIPTSASSPFVVKGSVLGIEISCGVDGKSTCLIAG
jgi:hypothetical protein